MLVYRVARAKYPALDGEGARHYGGRWNSPGTALVYTASSISLAVLETRVHLRAMPVDYVRFTIEISDSFREVVTMSPASLGIGWQTDLRLTRKIGDLYFQKYIDVPLKLKVPSVVIENEWNLLLTPAFAELNARIVDWQPIGLDPRLWS